MKRMLSLILCMTMLLSMVSVQADEVHVHACSHPNTDVYECREGAYKAHDDRAHEFSGNVYEEERCLDCGELLRRDLVDANAVITEGHHYHEWDEVKGTAVYTGVCSSCGHKNGCPHDDVHVEENDIKQPVYTQLDNGKHSVSGDRYVSVWCNQCECWVSDELAEKNATVTEDHHYYEWDENKGYAVYTGKCGACGYTNQCPHDDVHVNENDIDQAVYAPIDNREHSASGDRYVSVWCAQCEYQISRELAEKDATVTEGHHYYEWDEKLDEDVYTGVCNACGHRNGCSHENADVWDWIDGQSVAIDNRNHSTTGEVIESIHCHDCGYDDHVRTGRIETRELQHCYDHWNEKEDYDEYTGVCQECGHENTCEHVQSNAWLEVWDETACVKVNENEHEVFGDVFHRLRCEECGVDSRELIQRNGSVLEGHHYWNWDENRQEDVYTGVCRCGAEDPCTHENADRWDWVDGKSVTIDNRNHLTTGEVVESIHCHDCGYDDHIRTGRIETREQQHNYNRWSDEENYDEYTGVCQDCGHENTCEHVQSNAWLEVHNETDCQYVDENEHETFGWVFHRMQCEDCGVDSWNLIDPAGSAKEGHHYWNWDEDRQEDVYTGVCRCGAENPCKHENAERWDWVEGESVTIDNRNHLTTGEVVEGVHCYDCGYEEYTHTGRTETREQGHSYYYHNDEFGYDEYRGICQDCGHENTCEHVQSNAWLEVHNETDCQYVDENEHKAFGWVFHRVICEECGVDSWNLIDTEGSVLEGHHYWDWDEDRQEDVYTGICRCGAENPCKHENAERWDWVEGESVTIDNRNHLTTGEVVEGVRCYDCGYEEYTHTGRTETREQGHSYYYHNDEFGYDEYRGICQDCGHENTCDHVQSNTWLEVWGETACVKVDENEHEVFGDVFHRMHCDECGVDSSELVQRNGSVLEGHHYWDWDEDRQEDVYTGVCRCGAEDPCTHENAERWDWVEGESVTIDNRNHLTTGEVVEGVHCYDCGYEEYTHTGRTETREQGHGYYQHNDEEGYEEYTGVCQDCGHENTCEHVQSNTWLEVWGETACVKVDENEHEEFGDVFRRMHCEECGVDSSELVQRNGSVLYGHHYWDWDEERQEDVYTGICRCGAENPCKHENAERWDWVEGENVTIDNRNHLTTGEVVEGVRCHDCGYEEYIRTGRTETREQGHSYYYHNDEFGYDEYRGICQDCGHENTCAHEDAAEWEEVWERTDVQVVDDQYHREFGVVFARMICDDCGVDAFNLADGKDSADIEHQYWQWNEELEYDIYSDKCWVCGYEKTCTHENKESWEEVHNAEYQDLDDLMHTVTGRVFISNYCPDCDAGWLELVEENGTREYYHEYWLYDEENDTDIMLEECSCCGHKLTCTHENAERWYEVDGQYQTIDDRMHKVTGERIDWFDCPDCHNNIRVRTGKEDVLEEEHHYYDWDEELGTDAYDGVCDACGYENTCKHEGEVYVDEYDMRNVTACEEVDHLTHKVTGDRYLSKWCADCEFSFYAELLEKNITVTKEHWYEEGCCECGECGFICEHEESWKTYYIDDYTAEFEWIDAEYHKITGAKYEVLKCKSCRYYAWEDMKLVEENGFFEVPHSMEDGVCIWCGWSDELKEYAGMNETGTVSGTCVCAYAFAKETAEKLAELKDGDQVSVVGEVLTTDDKAWYMIELNGSVAYVAKENVTINKEPEVEPALNGWVNEGGKWYYYVEGVKAADTWMKDSAGWVYLGSDGAMLTEAWVMDSKGWCYVGASGYAVTNTWKQDSIGWCYLDSEGSMTKNAWVRTGDDWYWMNGEGYKAVSAWAEVDGKWYWLDGEGRKVMNSWMQDSAGWVYLGSEGAMMTEAWVQDSVGWCYVGANGYAVTNTWKQDSVGWCYLNASGSMTKNEWVRTGSDWYWLNGDGYKVTGGWVEVGGKWYWLDGEGRMVSNSWMQDSAGWVYLGSEGAMLTNRWVQDSVGWCYVGANGYAVTNCWKQDSTGWCYLDSNGSMVKSSWIFVDGNWYYLNAAGYRVSGTVWVDGKEENFDSNGVWIG